MDIGEPKRTWEIERPDDDPNPLPETVPAPVAPVKEPEKVPA